MNRILLMVLRNIFKVPKMWFKLCHYAKHTDEYPEQEKYDHIQKILRLAVTSGNINLQVTGQENIPADGGFLMYGNHQGMFDVLAIVATCDRTLGAVFKQELSNIPFLKQIIACTKSFALDRENARQAVGVFASVINEVKKGRNYLIFPEGTRSRNGNVMGEFHHGSFKCALRVKCPIVPVALIDSFRVLDEKGCKPVTVQLHYLQPIMPEEYEGMKTVELAELVKSRIQEVIDQNI